MSANVKITYGLADEYGICNNHHSVTAENELDAIISMCKQMKRKSSIEDNDFDGSYGWMTDGAQIYQYGGLSKYDNQKMFPNFSPFQNPYLNPDNSEFDNFLRHYGISVVDTFYVKPCYTTKTTDGKEVGCYTDIKNALRGARLQAKKIHKKNKSNFCFTAGTIVTVYDPFGDQVGYIGTNNITYKKDDDGEFRAY